MRLFAGVWPTEPVLKVLSDTRPRSATPDVRWVRPENLHVTLVFLGSVPDDEHDLVTSALRSIGPSTSPCTARLGPETSALGARVLCVPVGGLDQLAEAVRESTAPFNRSPDRDQPFLGHLTLARARRGRPIPLALTGVQISAGWSVSEIRLVSSTSGQEGARYSPVASVALGG